MRFKFYLRGCGLGILFTTIVLMIGFARADKPAMSDMEIMQRASELGMVKAEAVRDIEEPKPSEEEQQTAGQEKTEEHHAETEEAEGFSLNPPEVMENEDGSVVLIVKDGDVCRDIAAELYRTKIVKDAEEFRRFMGENGYSSQIRNGTYTFTPGLEYQQIAEILMNRQ